jgi:ATP-dependent DNA helicase RecG
LSRRNPYALAIIHQVGSDIMKVGKESEKLEFKKTTAELREGIISMGAILNKHGGGELYFGIRNDGSPLGQDISDKTLRDVSQAVANLLEPKIYPKINEVYIGEKACIHIEFSGDEPPYYVQGRAYIRVADEDRQMSATELERFILKKNAGRDAWDSEPSNKIIDDVNEGLLKEYLEQANRAGRIDFAYSSAKEALVKLGITDGQVVSNAGCAMFIGFPLLEVQMAVFATKQKLTFLDIRRSRGTIKELIETAVQYIIEKMSWRVVLDGSVQRKEIPEVPVAAIREAVTNSFCHRNYRSSQNNEVAIFSDRIEIYNPGKFPEGLTPEDFIEGKGRSVKRNPNLATLLYYSKDIESFGTGLQRIVATCEEANVRVSFENLTLGFSVVFYRSSYCDATQNVTEGNLDATQNVTEGILDVTDNVTHSISLSEIEVQLLKQIASKPSIARDELARLLSKNTRTIQRYLNGLKNKNLIRRVGSSKMGHWEFIQASGKELPKTQLD